MEAMQTYCVQIVTKRRSLHALSGWTGILDPERKFGTAEECPSEPSELSRRDDWDLWTGYEILGAKILGS